MATGYVELPVWAGVAPDGTDSENAPATPSKVVSSGSQTANSPKATFIRLLFSASADQHWMWPFLLPGNYASGGTLRATWSTIGTSSTDVRMKAAAAIGVVGTTDMDVIVFDTVVTEDWTPSTTQGVQTQLDLPLTMTNAAANRPIIVMVGRDVADSNANVASLEELIFEFVTT